MNNSIGNTKEIVIRKIIHDMIYLQKENERIIKHKMVIMKDIDNLKNIKNKLSFEINLATIRLKENISNTEKSIINSSMNKRKELINIVKDTIEMNNKRIKYHDKNLNSNIKEYNLIKDLLTETDAITGMIFLTKSFYKQDKNTKSKNNTLQMPNLNNNNTLQMPNLNNSNNNINKKRKRNNRNTRNNRKNRNNGKILKI